MARPWILILAIVMASASIACFRRRIWGWWWQRRILLLEILVHECPIHPAIEPFPIP
jgi:hypothetical protein